MTHTADPALTSVPDEVLRRAAEDVVRDAAAAMECPMCDEPVGHTRDCTIGRLERALRGVSNG